jgi:predicted aldo/keto reductase-like oxidoreductase
LRTHYIDYYFMHNFTDLAQWERLRGMGVEAWLAGKKASGEIRRAGFSFHGAYDEFVKLIDAYDWDFVQIQYNYLNEHYQAGAHGLRYAARKDLPVFVMEPLLGGKLAELPKGGAAVLRGAAAVRGAEVQSAAAIQGAAAVQGARPGSTPVGWALNWVWNQPEVTVVLSGMNAPAQLEENLRLADRSAPGMFTDGDARTVQKLVEVINKTYKIRCTGCNYCLPCPKKISIPACFAAYNASYSSGWTTGIYQYMTTVGILTDSPHFASDCIQCGACEKKCPQGIAIRGELKRVKRRLQIPGTKSVFPRIMNADRSR